MSKPIQMPEPWMSVNKNELNERIAHIVKCVDMHDELVNSLKRLADAIDAGNVSEQSLGTLEAYRLLAKVEGRSE